jgi:heme A synthase
MDNEPVNHRKRFSLCLLALLTATLCINLLSGYIRHTEAGLACANWPECYARVGAMIVPPDNEAVAALTPTDLAKQAHRAIATLLVVLVLLVVYHARQQSLPGISAFLPYAIVAIMLLLAVVGPASSSPCTEANRFPGRSGS